jgi:threonine-phosphate decarboxylase
MTLVHGGNVYEMAAQLGCSVESILDFSASINPLGPPDGLMGEFERLFHRTQHYPDIHNRALLDALVKHHRVAASRIVVGNGSTELIYWLPRVMGIQRAVAALPTFSEYQKAFELAGVEIHKVVGSSETGFQPTVGQLEEAFRVASPEAILVTHPGSPSGLLLSEGVVRWLLDGARAGAFALLVDEVFMDFCEEASLKPALDTCPNVTIIRSMTKFYGIPGLRLGYVLTSESLAERLHRFLPPWSVNTLAQVAGSYCLSQETYRERTLTLVKGERDFLQSEMGTIDGLTPLPGVANYLLVRLNERLPDAKVLVRDLLKTDRILVRDCSSFEGLGDRYFRVAVRLRRENERLLEGLARWGAAHCEG